MNRLQICLASRSPRRLELLRGVGLEPAVHPSSAESPPLPGETPRDHALRNAQSKGRGALSELAAASSAVIVIAADTIVTFDGEILGKPRDVTDAEEMLRRLRDRSHEVMTGVWLGRTDDVRTAGGVEVTRVRFRPYDDDWIRRYVKTGEPMDKAGAYGIQGRGAWLSSGIEGSWSNVVGFPLERLPGWLEDLGVNPRELLPIESPKSTDQPPASSS